MNASTRSALEGAPRTPHRSHTALLAAHLLVVLLFGVLLLGLHTGRAQAQEDVGGYVVQPGDTLGVIAARYGVTIDSLAALNGIADPNLLRVGQVLLIPGATGAIGDAQVPSVVVRALPGDTLAAVATRLGADAAVLSALNGQGGSARLFPGEPVRVPVANAPQEPLRFGAVTSVSLPESIEQGRTSRLIVETERPLVLTANWNGLNLPLAPLETITRQVTLVPAPALLAPATYPLTLTYSTRSGAPVSMRFDVDVADGGYFNQVISVPADRTDLLAPDNVAPELEKVVIAWSQFTSDLVQRAPFVRPIAGEYPTSSPFGTRRYYDSGPNSYDGYHAGQDFSAPTGVAVYSPAPGIVTLAETLSVRGNAVILDHGRGIFTGYWHLSEMNVTPGQSVNTGDVIGLVGNTGLSTGAHLHWELRIHGIAVDPMQFLTEAPFP